MKKLVDALQGAGVPALAAYFERPVTGHLYETLQRRANAFEFNGRSLPCSIMPELTYDLGARRLNNQLFLAVIDTGKSKELVGEISRRLGYKATRENTGAALVVERRFSYQLSNKLKKPAWAFDEFLLVTRLEDGGRVSPHVLTPTAMRSIIVPPASERKLKEAASEWNAMIPTSSKLIRGLGEAAVAWNGKEWGLVDVVPDGNLIVGGRTVEMGKLGKFRAADVGHALQVGMAGRHGEFDVPGSGLVIPGSAPRGRGGFRDWFMVHSDVPIVVTSDPGDAGGGSGGGGGGGSQGGTDVTWVFSGTGSCARDFSSWQACHACCDGMGQSVLAVGLPVSLAIGTAVASTAVGVPIGVVVGAVLVIVTLGIAWGVVEACKDACDNASGAGAGQTAGAGSEWIT